MSRIGGIGPLRHGGRRVDRESPFTDEDPDEGASGGGGGGVSPSLGLREEKRRLPAARPSATVVETGALAKSAAMPLPLDPPPEGRGPPELILPDAALAAAIFSDIVWYT